MRAMQATGRISTVVHLGNPYVLEDIPHVPRKIFGNASTKNSLVALEVLAGNYPPLGTPTYDVKLK